MPLSARGLISSRFSDESVSIVSGAIVAITDAHALTETQRDRLTSAYESIGQFLAEHPTLGGVTVEVHPQGSMLIGTSTRPEGRTEMDVDLVLLLKPGVQDQINCRQLLDVVHQAMCEYAKRHDLGIEQKRRCVQLQYADEMHADVTPVVHSPKLLGPHGDTFGLVPDRELSRYMGTNPKGYGLWVNAVATRKPLFGKRVAVMDALAKAEVAPLPSIEIFDRLLARIIQILKIHRNKYFAQMPDLAPPSVVITTTAVQSYLAALGDTFDTPLDLMMRMWRDMPTYIQRRTMPRGEHWTLGNPTAAEDNLADRMNSSPERQDAFDDWHRTFGVNVLGMIELAGQNQGMDALCKSVSTLFGSRAGDSVSAALRASINGHRDGQRIVVPVSAASTSASLLSTVPVRMKSQPHRFFGRDE